MIGRSWPWWRWVLTGLSALGLALSGYLGWHYLEGGSVIGCGGGSRCDEVLNSRWSAVGGVLPVSGLAAGAYLAVLAASLSIGPATASPVRRIAWRAMLVLTGSAAGSAVWFTVVQKWKLGAFCPYCMATHVTGLLLAALVFWQAPRQVDDNLPASPGSETPEPPASRRMIGKFPALAFSVVGVVLAGILAASQIAFTPPTVSRAGESGEKLPVIDPHAGPLTGSPDAPYVVALLFDYKCPHCQQLHFMLDEAIRRYDGKLAFALCPAPLSRQCNPYVPRDVDEFTNSCELAKVALAVWVAKREAFPAFNRWMFLLDSGDRWHPRTLDAAKSKAIELVGQTKFDAAQTDPWVDRYLQTCIQLYGNTGGNAVPKLVFHSRWVLPQPADADDLVSILRDKLAVGQ